MVTKRTNESANIHSAFVQPSLSCKVRSRPAKSGLIRELYEQSKSHVAGVRSASIGGSVTEEASPRAGAFFLELVLDEPVQDAVWLLDAVWFRDAVWLRDVVRLQDVARSADAARYRCGVHSPVETQSADEARVGALLELGLLLLGEVRSSRADYFLVWA